MFAARRCFCALERCRGAVGFDGFNGDIFCLHHGWYGPVAGVARFHAIIFWYYFVASV